MWIRFAVSEIVKDNVKTFSLFTSIYKKKSIYYIKSKYISSFLIVCVYKTYFLYFYSSMISAKESILGPLKMKHWSKVVEGKYLIVLKVEVISILIYNQINLIINSF